MQERFSLKDNHTFHFDVTSAYYTEIDSTDKLKQIILNKEFKSENIFVLGGGSNVLFQDNFSGHILHPIEKSINVIQKDEEDVLVRVSAGVVWDDFVGWAVERSFYGIENLSLIPGQVGAVPVQNIGAYGVEAKDCIEYVEGLYLDNAEPFTILGKDCEFAYRESIFKKRLKSKIFVSHVVFRLSVQEKFHLDYGALKERVLDIGELTLENIRSAVIEIRNEKLPNTDDMGNAGSFFKNPVINLNHLDKIRKEYPDVKYYEVDGMAKVPAGWLIDKSGWKGYRKGDAGVHEFQALVLVNYGNAIPRDIINLAEVICKDIKEKFDIDLEMEVTIV